MESVVGLEPRAIWTWYMRASLCERIHEWWRGGWNIVTCNKKALPKRETRNVTMWVPGRVTTFGAEVSETFKLHIDVLWMWLYTCVREALALETACQVRLTIYVVNISHLKAENIKPFTIYCRNYKWSTNICAILSLSFLRIHWDNGLVRFG
jgi:hypothetical protein